MIKTRLNKKKKDNIEQPEQKHTFYMGNRGNHTVWMPWGRCSCGISLEEPHLIVEHVEQHDAYINNSNAYTMLKYIVQEDN